jgi:PAS domain S-box-containing protein
MTASIEPNLTVRPDMLHGDPVTRPTPQVMLQLERDFLSKVVDHMDTLLVVLDAHGRIVRFNRACERLFGYTTEEIRAKLGTGALPLPKELGAIKLLLGQIKAHHHLEQYESQWQSSSGQMFTIAWSISFLRRADGEIEYVFATGTDITSRKQAELMLERERSLLQSLINAIPDLIFYKDATGCYLGCNTAFGKFRNGHAQDVVGHKDIDLYRADLAAMFSRTDQHVMEAKDAVQYENWTRGADGKAVLIETRKTPYFDRDGQVQGVIGIGRDITRHRLVENALREAKLEIEQIISSLSSALIFLTVDLHILRWNPMAQTILGVTPEQARKRRLDELTITWDWQAISGFIEHVRQSGKALNPPPVRFRRTDGGDGFLGFNIGPVFDQQGRLSGFILLVGDITQRKMFENRLAQSQRLESIGQLAAGIAHEINTPIQYIGNNASFIQENFQPLLELLTAYDQLAEAVEQVGAGEEILSQVRQVRQKRQETDVDFLQEEVPAAIAQTMEGVRRVSEIVTAMKAFSHPGVKEKKPYNLNQALENTLAVTRNEWKYVAGVETHFAPDLPDVMCHPGEINQVFLNIIVNAAQAIVARVETNIHDKGLITISTSHNHGWVEIRISDNGTGIPEEARTHVFEPFFTTKDVGKGTGQGLAIAYDVVECKHGGELTFETEMGVGTTFIVRLPVKAADLSKEENSHG